MNAKDRSDSSRRPALFVVALCQIRRLPPRRVLPTLPVLNALLASSLGLGTVLALGTAQAAAPASPLSLNLIGSVEVQGQARKRQQINTALRTGTGQAVLIGPSSRLTMGSSSLMRVYNNQPDMQSGRFYIVGAAQLYALGTHPYTQGQVRLDVSGPVQRVDVIARTLRLSPGGRSP